MAWSEEYPRKYYSKYKRRQVANDHGWYEVYEVEEGVFCICEPQHFQEVHFYLICGSKRALLFDTGMGFYPIRPLISELYDGEVIVCNSHFHFDHIGSNYAFDKVWAHVDPLVAAVAEHGLPHEAYGSQLEEEMFQFGIPEDLELGNFAAKGYNALPLAEGQIFDLGGRSLEVIFAPGHSQDGVVLYDEENKILFTGDFFYTGALYAFFDNEIFGKSSCEEYYRSAQKLNAMLPEDVRLFCSHNEPVAEGSCLKKLEQALGEVINGSAPKDDEVGKEHVFLEDGTMLAEFPAGVFSIVYAIKEENRKMHE